MRHILDAGPLIAALNRRDTHHKWASETLAHVGPPFYTCAEAISEAAALTRQPVAILQLIEAGEIILALDLREQASAVMALLTKYQDREMDLADACIVRMAELFPDSRVITTDRNDFEVFRRNGRDVIPIIAPPR